MTRHRWFDAPFVSSRSPAHPRARASAPQAAKLFPRNPVAPWAASLAYGIGGAYFRMLERAHRGLPTTEAHYDAIRARARVVLAYVSVYTAIRRARGHDTAQVLVALFDVSWKPRDELHPAPRPSAPGAPVPPRRGLCLATVRRYPRKGNQYHSSQGSTAWSCLGCDVLGQTARVELAASFFGFPIQPATARQRLDG